MQPLTLSPHHRHVLLVQALSEPLRDALQQQGCCLAELPAPAADADAGYGEALVALATAHLAGSQAELLVLPSPAPGDAASRAWSLACLEAARRRGGLDAAWVSLADAPDAPPVLCGRVFAAGALFEALVWAALAQAGPACAPIATPLAGPEAPRVSVIVRSMGRPSLAAALASVALQTYRPIQLVVVNALGSAHGPLPMAAMDGLELLQVAGPAGAGLRRAAAANAGLDAASGELALFLDDDDLLLPDHLARLVAELAAHREAGAAYADVERGHSLNGVWHAEHGFAADFDPVRLLFENYLPIHGVLFRRTGLLPTPRFDESFDLFEDWDFWLQVAACAPMRRVPGFSARYVSAGDGQSEVFDDSPAAHAARQRLYEKWHAQGGPAQQALVLHRLQVEHRHAAHAQAELALLQQGHNEQAAVLQARQQELASAIQQIQGLQEVIQARERELTDAMQQIQSLQEVIQAREREVADALVEIGSVRQVLGARDEEIAALHAAAEPARQAGIAVPVANTVVFTIVSRNYFHFALNLMASVAQHLPGTRRVVAVCDALDGLVVADPGIELVGVQQLGIAALETMVLQYTILELNTAIKPFVFSHLFARADVGQVIYFDPDIQLYGSGAPLLQRLQTADVVLTPHLTAPLADDKHPSDLAILQSGTYNLGFLALRRSDDTAALLRWWQAKLERDCVVDIPRGLFTDQKWMDLVPGFCPHTHIERHPGWNVAYWNLLHRHVESSVDGFTVNGQPLFFFHFSGYDPRGAAISKHQDRFALADCTPAVQQLFAQYTQSLADTGRERWAAMPYAFARLADGTPLPDCARRAIRKHFDWNAPRPALNSAEGAQFVLDFLTAPVDEHQPPITRLALQLYEDRADLQAAFPNMLAARREAYLNWFAERAGPEAGIGAAWTRPPQRAAQAVPVAQAGAAAVLATAATPAAAPAGLAAPVLPYRMVYRLAWKARHVLRPMTSLAFRQRMREGLLRRAFPGAAGPAAGVAGAVPAAAPAAAQAARPPGVTVIGYVQAESGVGESARATLRALAHTDIPHAVRDYRVGNVSRMGEAVDAALATGCQHAISLFHINADQLPQARTFLGDEPYTGTYRIGFWAWELENFPAEWHGAFAHVDEVWVPSSFCQRAIAAVSPVPVLVMPHAVDVPQQLAPDRARFGLREDSVAFLAMADMMSIAGRKNPFAAVHAFRAAFEPHDTRVQLVVKIANAHRDAAAMAQLRALVAGHPQIHLLAESLDRPALNALLDSVDCFVSLHRSEGFGLVIAEAMARGKVVVATAWSGNMDFMTAHNTLPVDYTLVRLEQDFGPYRKGERWAEPSLDDAVVKLRRVAGDSGLRAALGTRARDDVTAQISAPVIGARVRDRLRLLLQVKSDATKR